MKPAARDVGTPCRVDFADEVSAMMTGWVLLVCAMGAMPLADDVVYQEGIRQYEDFEYEKAVFRFKEAARNPEHAPSERAIILVRLGMTYAELRDLTSTDRSFDEAIENDPLVTLPTDASPKIKTMLDKARARAQEKRSAAPVAPDEVPPDEPLDVSPVPADGARVDAPGDVPANSGAPEAPPLEEEGTPWLLVGGGAVAAAGLIVALVGAAAWGGGVGLSVWASGQPFQSDAATWVLPSAVAQIGGQVALGVGAAVLVGGAVLAGVGLLVE